MSEQATVIEPLGAGYPLGAYPEPRRMGQFNWLQMAGFTVVAEDQLVTRSYFGLRHTDTWFDAYLTAPSGQFYVVANNLRSEADGRLQAGGMIGGFRATADGLAPDPRYGQWSGGVAQQLSDARLRYSATGPTSPERVDVGASDFGWIADNGDLGLAGAPCGSGTQWHHAWRRPDGETGEMFYCHQAYRVGGTYFGEPVTGHVLVENMWGNENYVDTWFVQNRIGHWASFMVDYDDGTSEHGQILCGEYGARGAVVVDGDGREVLCTTNVNAVEHPDGGMRYELGNGETWELAVDPTRALTFPRTRLGFGRCTRVGETRQIVSANGNYLTADRLPPPLPVT